ncbi:hypothetical protein BC567DRAFT_102614 [Phyllosticta citribraziliensis]
MRPTGGLEECMCVITRKRTPCAALIHSSPSSHPSLCFCFAHQSPTASPFTVKSSLTLALRGGSLFMLFFPLLQKPFLHALLSLSSPIKQSVEFIMTFAFSVRWELGSWWGGRVCVSTTIQGGWVGGERETWLGTTAALTFFQFSLFSSSLSLQNSSLFALSFSLKHYGNGKFLILHGLFAGRLRLLVDCRWLSPLLLLLLVRRWRWRRDWSEAERRCW